MNEVSRLELLDYVAPCSLLCYTCPAYKDGAIAQCAAKLYRYFEGYYDFNEANLPEEYHSRLSEFKVFHDRLGRYAQRRCVACRNNPSPGSGCIEGCVIPECAKEHHVDFCGECSAFPCANARAFLARINPIIVTDWENGSQRIREVGIRQYFEEKKSVSHYLSYKRPDERQCVPPSCVCNNHNQ